MGASQLQRRGVSSLLDYHPATIRPCPYPARRPPIGFLLHPGPLVPGARPPLARGSPPDFCTNISSHGALIRSLLLSKVPFASRTRFAIRSRFLPEASRRTSLPGKNAPRGRSQRPLQTKNALLVRGVARTAQGRRRQLAPTPPDWLVRDWPAGRHQCKSIRCFISLSVS